MTMMAVYLRALMPIVLPVRALAARAWMWFGHCRCHQKLRSVEKPPTTCDKESKKVIAEGSLGTRWAMGQQRKMELSVKINLMRVMRLVSCLEMKC